MQLFPPEISSVGFEPNMRFYLARLPFASVAYNLTVRVFIVSMGSFFVLSSAPANLDKARGARLERRGLRLLLSTARHDPGDYLAATESSQGKRWCLIHPMNTGFVCW